ncbi:MAG: DUF3696 domain-containing protein [Bryobacterales bacterium]|nr:DUF3696 domain-containing protein [Bryobacterales bacterium]
MLESIELANFKAFREQTIPVSALTILSGLNGSGKSTLLQSLLVLAQSWELGYLERGKVALNGRHISLGTYGDVLFEGATDESAIKIGLRWIGGEYERFTITGTYAEQRVCQLESSLSETAFGARCRNLRFLRAERIGPRVNHELSEMGVAYSGLGISGEFVAEFLAREGARPIAVSGCQHAKAVSTSLRDNAEAWMSEFSPNLRLLADEQSDQDRVRLRYQYEHSRGISNEYRPTNVGFGVSYALPVVVTVLAAKPGDLLLIEAPEAHLHPKGQATMGELMARAAQCGVQMIVETHSDHVMNGIRVAVHQRLVDHSKVAFLYFEWDPKHEDGATTVQRLAVDSRGRIDHWPAGFFDETDKSLEVLLGPQPEA